MYTRTMHIPLRECTKEYIARTCCIKFVFFSLTIQTLQWHMYLTCHLQHTGWPRINGTVDTVDFQDFALINN